MYDVKLISSALNRSGGENYCDPEPLAVALYESIPANIRSLFNAPKGAMKDGKYVGSVIQIAKGTMKRLHGPSLEMLAANMLEWLMTLNEEESENPGIITYQGVKTKWDVRRYSSSRDSQGKWQSLPDFSYYIGCTAQEYASALRGVNNSNEEKTTTGTEWK